MSRNNGYRYAWAQLREIYGPNCAYCHRNPATQIDHVIPYAYIQCNKIENLRPACQWCNLMASDKVFEGFDEKYEWLREQRAAGKWKGKYRMHTCSECLIPFYTMMHNSDFLCPHCYAVEYETQEARGGAWESWKKLLKTAGFVPAAHFQMAEKLHGFWGIPYTDRVEHLVEQYAEHLNEFVDIDTVIAFSGYG